jgi:hypothetical protein
MNIIGWVLFGVSFIFFLFQWVFLLFLTQTHERRTNTQDEKLNSLLGKIEWVLLMIVTILSSGVGLYIIKNFP